MKNLHKHLSLVIADPELHHHQSVKNTLQTFPLHVDASSVYSGLQLMDFLLQRESYADSRLHLPDLILLELEAPLMDGFEVLKQIQFNEKLSRIPVYLMAKKRIERDRLKAQALGARGFLLKPITAEDLHRILDPLTGLHMAA